MWVCLKQYNPMCIHAYVWIKKNNIVQLQKLGSPEISEADSLVLV